MALNPQIDYSIHPSPESRNQTTTPLDPEAYRASTYHATTNSSMSLFL